MPTQDRAYVSNSLRLGQVTIFHSQVVQGSVRLSLSIIYTYIYIHVEQIQPLAQPFIRSNALRRDLLSVQIFSVTADEI